MNWSDCRCGGEPSVSADGGDNRIQTVVSDGHPHSDSCCFVRRTACDSCCCCAAVVTTTSCHYPAGCCVSLFHVTARAAPELELEMSGQLGGYRRHRDLQAGRMMQSIDIRVLKRWQQQPQYGRGWSVLDGKNVSPVCRICMPYLCSSR